MGPLDAANHLLNLFLPALALGSLSAALVKLLWRRELANVSWARLAALAAGAAVAVALTGLLIFGRDGRMATYSAMVLACAITLWWRGFGPGRRQAR